MSVCQMEKPKNDTLGLEGSARRGAVLVDVGLELQEKATHTGRQGQIQPRKLLVCALQFQHAIIKYSARRAQAQLSLGRREASTKGTGVSLRPFLHRVTSSPPRAVHQDPNLYL